MNLSINTRGDLQLDSLTHSSQIAMFKSLADLPVELIDIIAKFTPESSLPNLIRCSKHIANITIPILYARFEDNRPEKLSAFVKSLLFYPHLARGVKEICVSRESPGDQFGRVSTSFLTDELIQWIRINHIKDEIYGKQVCAAWIDQIVHSQAAGHGGYDQVLALLLLLTSNNLVSIELAYFSGYRWVTRAIRGMTEFSLKIIGQDLLSNLRNIHITHRHAGTHHNIISHVTTVHDIYTFLKIPSIKKFVLDGAYLTRFGGDFLEGTGVFSEEYTFFATDVEIRGHFDSMSMKFFLRSCVALKRFKFTQLGPDYRGHQLSLLPSAVAEGLQGHKKTLQELNFDNQASALPQIAVDALFEEPLKNREEFRNLTVYEWRCPKKPQKKAEEAQGNRGAFAKATSRGGGYGEQSIQLEKSRNESLKLVEEC